LSLDALNATTRQRLAEFLDMEGTIIRVDEREVLNNYAGLAELAGFTYPQISALQVVIIHTRVI